MAVTDELCDSMPRVCVVTEGFYPPSIGGQQRQLHDLGKRLVAKGIAVMVITRQSDPPAAEREYIDQMRVIRVSPGGLLSGRGWHALVPLLHFIWRLFWLLVTERDQYDVLLISGTKVLPIPVIIAGHLLRKPCVVRAESPIEFWQDFSEKSLQRMKLSKRSRGLVAIHAIRNEFLKRAERVIAISTQLRTVILDEGVCPERVELVPNGIDTTRFHPADDAEKRQLRLAHHLSEDATIFVFTGRLAVSKGLPELMQAWQKLMRDYPTVHLLMVGTGLGCFDDYEPEMRSAIAQQHLEDCITLTGATDHVDDYLRASDLFVFPSRYEGFGLSIIEAMACGLPAVVTNVGVALDVIQSERNGVLVPIGDAIQLETAMRWMLEHREQWPSMGAACSVDIGTRYSLEFVSQRYSAIFTQLVARKPHGTHRRLHLIFRREH